MMAENEKEAPLAELRNFASAIAVIARKFVHADKVLRSLAVAEKALERAIAQRRQQEAAAADDRVRREDREKQFEEARRKREDAANAEARKRKERLQAEIAETERRLREIRGLIEKADGDLSRAREDAERLRAAHAVEMKRFEDEEARERRKLEGVRERLHNLQAGIASLGEG